MGDGKFKSIEPNEEILEIGKDENEETPEQLELERKKVEQEQNFEVPFVWAILKLFISKSGAPLGPRFSNLSRSWSSPVGYFQIFLVLVRSDPRIWSSSYRF